jgi:hypothetical protein
MKKGENGLFSAKNTNVRVVMQALHNTASKLHGSTSYYKITSRYLVVNTASDEKILCTAKVHQNHLNSSANIYKFISKVCVRTV